MVPHGGPAPRAKWTDRSGLPARVSGVKSPDTSPADARSGPAPTTMIRPMRSDALKNRERLLVAAGQVFEEKGLEASVADVARAAGVGMGTLYRHFPSKEALVEALVSDVLETTIALARDAAARPDGTGLEHFLRESSAYQAEHLGCLPKLWITDHHLVQTARELIAGLLADAQAHGRVRLDLRSTDISLALWSIRGVLETTGPNAPEAWKRHLESADRRHAPDRRRVGAAAAQPEPGRPDPFPARSAAGAVGRGEPMTTLQDTDAGAHRQGDDPGPPVDPRRHRRGAAHGGARHDDHDHRPALGAARARLLQHRSAVGGHRLHVGVRRLPPPRRAHQRHDRAEAHADDRRDRLRPGVGRRRSGADHAHADRRPRAAGPLRRAVGPVGAVDPHLDLLRPEGAGACLRDLRHHRHRRVRLRAHPRRLPDPVRRLALVPVREPARSRDWSSSVPSG